MKMYGSEGLDVIEDGWIGQGIKKERKGVLVPLYRFSFFPNDLSKSLYNDMTLVDCYQLSVCAVSNNRPF